MFIPLHISDKEVPLPGHAGWRALGLRTGFGHDVCLLQKSPSLAHSVQFKLFSFLLNFVVNFLHIIVYGIGGIRAVIDDLT